MAKSNTLPIEQTSIATIHNELNEWRQQTTLWLDELEVWHKEHEVGLSDLARLEQAYHELAVSVSKVREGLTTHDQNLHAHERTLAEYLQGNEALSFSAIEQQHRTTRARHAEQEKQLKQTQQLFQEMLSKMEVVRRALATTAT